MESGCIFLGTELFSRPLWTVERQAGLQRASRMSNSTIFPSTDTELLVSTGLASPTVERAVWTVALPSGSPHRLGETKALWASWSRDNQHIGYAANDGLYLMQQDKRIRKLTSVPGLPGKLQFSPMVAESALTLTTTVAT